MAEGPKLGIIRRKKKQMASSKKRKRSWRKHSDVKDVEEYQNEKRKEAIISGVISDKTDEQLFLVDNKSESHLNTGQKHWKTAPLRCFQILLPDSCIPPPVIPNVTVKNRLLPRHLRRLNPKTKAEDNKTVRRRLEVERNRLLNAKRKAEEAEATTDDVATDTYDLWDPSFEEKVLRNSGRKPAISKEDQIYIKVPLTCHTKPSARPAVEVPDAGASYNPTVDDHRSLLYAAHEVEVKRVKEEQKLARGIAKFVNLGETPKEDVWLQEMSQGIVEDPLETSSEDDCSYGPLSINPPVRDDKRKSAIQRRREARRKKAATKERLKKLQALRETEVFRIRSLKREISKAEEESRKATLVRRQKQREKALYGQAVIGSYKYQEPDIEVNLTGELGDSLRTMRTDGDLLVDRYKSFQRRNIIEPRIQQTRVRKYKLKTYVKDGHDFKK